MKAYNTPNDELRIESDNGDELVKITSDGVTAKSGLSSMPKITLTEEELVACMSGTTISKTVGDIVGFPTGDFFNNMAQYILLAVDNPEAYLSYPVALVTNFKGVDGDYINFSSVVRFYNVVYFSQVLIYSDGGHIDPNTEVSISAYQINGGAII